MTLARVPDVERDPAARHRRAGLVTFTGALFCSSSPSSAATPRAGGARSIVGLFAAAWCCWPPSSSIERRRRAADARPHAVPQARVRRRVDRGVLAARLDVLDVPLPHALPAERRWATRRSRPACASCPVSLLSFVVAPLAGKLSERAPRARLPRRRADARGLRAAAHERHPARSTTGPRCCPASSSPASASASSTRRSPPRRSASWSRSAAAWRPGINSTFRQVGIATGIAGPRGAPPGARERSLERGPGRRPAASGRP